MDEKKLLTVCSEVICEIERHQKQPISRGKVVVPLLCPLDDSRQIFAKLREALRGAVTHVAEDNTFIEVGSVLVYCAQDALTDPVRLRGDTALMYVMKEETSITKYAREILMSTVNLTLATARFNGLGGRVEKY